MASGEVCDIYVPGEGAVCSVRSPVGDPVVDVHRQLFKSGRANVTLSTRTAEIKVTVRGGRAPRVRRSASRFQALVDAAVLMKSGQGCSHCGYGGHNVATCPLTKTVPSEFKPVLRCEHPRCIFDGGIAKHSPTAKCRWAGHVDDFYLDPSFGTTYHLVCAQQVLQQ